MYDLLSHLKVQEAWLSPIKVAMIPFRGQDTLAIINHFKLIRFILSNCMKFANTYKEQDYLFLTEITKEL